MPEQTSDNDLSVFLIGCGNMGAALLNGWLSAPQIITINVLDPHPLPEIFQNQSKVNSFQDIAQASDELSNADIIILAVKPQIMDEICIAIKPYTKADALIISIAAGKIIACFETHFGKAQPIIRAMPNLPSQIGKSVTVLHTNKAANPTQQQNAATLFTPYGIVEWLNDENLMDAVTAISGSGPAYIFHLIETLAKSGEKQGLPAKLAMTLARQTVIGSAAMAEETPNTPAATLRENVTSPGGTTAAALGILMNGELQDIYNSAIDAAAKRGKELSS